MAFADAHASNPIVGGAEMLAEKNVIENAVNSPIHTKLVAAVTQAGLVDTLSGPGPFTVFAPTDDAFGLITDETLSALMMDENKARLATILTCHVVGAEVFADAIGGKIAADSGAHPVATLGGCTLMAEMSGDAITLTDENGDCYNRRRRSVQRCDPRHRSCDAAQAVSLTSKIGRTAEGNSPSHEEPSVTSACAV